MGEKLKFADPYLYRHSIYEIKFYNKDRFVSCGDRGKIIMWDTKYNEKIKTIKIDEEDKNLPWEKPAHANE